MPKKVKLEPTPQQKKKWAMHKAQVNLHQALFEMRRMDFEMISALAYAASGGNEKVNTGIIPSDVTFFRLKRDAEQVLSYIQTAQEALAPYIERRLTQDGK